MAVKVTTRTRAAQATAQTAKPAPKKAPAKTAARATASATAPARKTATKAPATKTAARATATATPSRARKAAAPVVKDNPEPRTRAKKGTPAPQTAKQLEKSAAQNNTLQERRESMNPRRKVGGLTYQQVSDLSGYGLGTEQFIAAVEIISGGETKIAVSHRIAALLPETTRNGTPKQISNLVGGVIRNLEARGFTISGTWKMAAPKA